MGKRRTKATKKLAKRKPTKLEQIAYHEAGHAVACHILRMPYRHVTIIPDREEGSLGHLAPAKPPEGFDPELDTDPRTRRRSERHAMVCMAGLCAAKTLTGRHNFYLASLDMQSALSILINLCGSMEETEIYCHLMWLRIRRKLAVPQNWAAIKALAEALLERKHIGSRTARSIIREAMRIEMGIDKDDPWQPR